MFRNHLLTMRRHHKRPQSVDIHLLPHFLVKFSCTRLHWENAEGQLYR
ncbi:hypothetical protein M3J09_007170 [Ascochyta lentis]